MNPFWSAWARYLRRSKLDQSRCAKGRRRASRPTVKPRLELLEDRLAPANIVPLASFNFGNGAYPYAGLVEDSSGNLFGTTNAGGAFGDGTVFEVAHNIGTITTLASFNNSNGANPYAGLIEDSAGNLFGTTLRGGAFGYGTVFEVAHNTGTITTLASFNNTNGAYPYAGLVEDSSGNLFGTTYRSASSYGTVFEVAHNTGTITTLASFNNSTGYNPYAGLVEDSSGNLFGTTIHGGASGVGTVFEVAYNSGTVTTLASFNNSTGANPYAGLVEDSSGNLFGTTIGGGASGGYGTVFEVAPNTGTINTLASFNNSNGSVPYGGLVEDSSGNLFGTTVQGSSSGGYGTVFEVAHNTGTITTLASFNNSNGANPYAGLVEDSSGNLFGTTYGGGPSGGYGTVFAVTGSRSGYVVTTTADSGPGSLRDAITQINADTNHSLYASPLNPGVDEIDFDITAASDVAGGGNGYSTATNVATITPGPGNPLPTITNAVLIDGYTQPGSSWNTNPFGQADNAVLKVELNGAADGNNANGLTINAPNTTVCGLVINRFANDGINVSGAGSNASIYGNFLGTDPTGTIGEGNLHGIYINSAAHVTVGGAPTGSGNLVSGNQDGIISVFNSAVTIQGNYVGTDFTGGHAVPNVNGVLVGGTGSNNLTIGGATNGAGNLISGNSNDGLSIAVTAGPVLVQGNRIGTDAGGTYAIGNGDGIRFSASSNVTIGGVDTNTPGTPLAGAGNLISGNVGNGIGLADWSTNNTVEGNYMGTDWSGKIAVPNSVGLAVSNTSNNAIINNVISGNSTGGVFFTLANNITLQKNLIGTDATGNIALPNKGVGVNLLSTNTGNQIGTPGQGNVISGNIGGGVELQYADDTNNLVQGNFIGTNAAGNSIVGTDGALLGNSGFGVLDYTSPNNTIGGAGAGNVIAGNQGYGLGIGNPSAIGNVVQGNSIGTDVSGTLALGNTGPGVDVFNNANSNLIGGTAAGNRNTIAFNGQDGVFVQQGYAISILGDSIHDNGGLGIHLANGANDNQPAPVLTSVVRGATTTVNGTLAGTTSGTSYWIEFFASASPSGAAKSAGQTFLGSLVVTGNGGTASFTASGLAAIPVGQNYVTATATVATAAGSAYTYSATSAFSVAPVLTVTNLLDDGSPGSLRAVVTQADADAAHGYFDVINFDPSLAGKTITLTSGQLELSGSGTITIDSSSLASQVTISGNNASRVFQVDFGLQAEFDNLTITAGLAQNSGGGIYNNGILTLSGSTLSHNVASINGGGVFNSGTLTANSSTLSGNSASSGGGVFNSGTLTANSSTISSNSASNGGGFYVNWGAVTISGCTLSGNTAYASGGGIFNNDYNNFASIAISNCTLSGNSAGFGGGIENNINYGTLTLSGCTLSGNTASYSGGGISNGSPYGTIIVSGSTLSGNSASQGGGIANSASLTLDGSTLADNTASQGGNIWNLGTITDQGRHASAIYLSWSPSSNPLNQGVYGNILSGTPIFTSSVTGLTASVSPGRTVSSGQFVPYGQIIYTAQVLAFGSSAATATGSVELVDGNGKVFGTASLNSLGQASFYVPTGLGYEESLANPTPFNALYLGGNFGGSKSALLIPAVNALAPNNLQSLVSSLLRTSSFPSTAVALNITPAAEQAAINAINSLSGSGYVTVVLNLAPGTYTPVTLSHPNSVTVIINGVVTNTIIDPDTPALTVTSGNVIVEGVTFTETGDAPAILVTGGDLTLRNSSVQGSTNYSDPAIAVSGGSTVDLGSAASPGGNTITVTSTAPAIQSTGTNVILAAGDTIQASGVPVSVVANIALASSANPSLLNEPVTFSATVSVPSAGSAAPTGNVTFVDQTTSSTLAVVPLSGGAASWTGSGLAINAHSIAAIYSGDGNYISSAATLVQQVDYAFSGFSAPLTSNLAFGLNRTIPIKFQLTDYSGVFISNLTAIQSLQVLDSTGTNVLTNAGSTALRYDSTAKQFIANWSTKGLAAGTYTVTLTLADGTTYTKTVTLSKTGTASGLTTTAAGGTSTAVGALLGGDIDLYVDNSNGDLTADELARIQDAVTAADAVTEPYGVAVVEVTDPTLADVTLNMDTTSAVGGYADGVLGCTTDAGQITVINGWNFYAGSDATQIGSAQYDFETVVTHELGHALGLGHSTVSTSVMYATLNTGEVNRSLTTADLNVPDTGTGGACGLHAAGLPQSESPARLAGSSEASSAAQQAPANALVFSAISSSSAPVACAPVTVVSGQGLPGVNGSVASLSIAAAGGSSRSQTPMWEGSAGNSVTSLAADAKQSFAEECSQTEFGNEVGNEADKEAVVPPAPGDEWPVGHDNLIDRLYEDAGSETYWTAAFANSDDLLHRQTLVEDGVSDAPLALAVVLGGCWLGQTRSERRRREAWPAGLATR
jgi:uncharacterized repeat protein (TIGR03803 family)